jgi:hypothetical protein
VKAAKSPPDEPQGNALATAVCSIATTQRRRFFWAAWWTEPPCERPFRKPDASNGGAPTWEAALAEAEHAAGRTLTPVDARWARAWMRVLRGQPPISPSEAARRAAKPKINEPEDTKRLSIWALLGLEPDAGVDEIKKAYRRRALETHPDRGGDADVFRAVQVAYERALAKRHKADKRPARKKKPGA